MIVEFRHAFLLANGSPVPLRQERRQLRKSLPEAASIGRVVMMRPGTVTHSFDILRKAGVPSIAKYVEEDSSTA